MILVRFEEYSYTKIILFAYLLQCVVSKVMHIDNLVLHAGLARLPSLDEDSLLCLEAFK